LTPQVDVVFSVAIGDEIDVAVAVHVRGLDPGADANGPTEIASFPESPSDITAVHDEEVAVRVVPTGGGSHLTADDVGEAIAVQVTGPDVLRSIQTLGYQMLGPEIVAGVGRRFGPQDFAVWINESLGAHHIDSPIAVHIEAGDVLDGFRE
jgi:hypothetical protein